MIHHPGLKFASGPVYQASPVSMVMAWTLRSSNSKCLRTTAAAFPESPGI